MPARPLSCLATFLFLAAPAAAQTSRDSARLDEIVVTATRAPTRLRALGSASERVPEREALTRQLFGVRDALRLLPGAAVFTSGGPGGVTSVFLRGVSSTQTLILVDGVRVNDANAEPGGFLGGADGAATALEVVRGPQSTLYGGAAIGGVIALDLPLTGAPSGWLAAADGGSFGTWRGLVQGRGTAGRLSYVTALTANGTDNERRPNGWSQRSQALRLEAAVSPRIRVGTTFRGLQSDYTSPGDLRTSNPTPAGETTFENHLGTLYLEAQPLGRWTSRLLAGGQRQFTRGTGAFFGDPFAFRLAIDRTVLDWQNTVAVHHRLRVVAGANREWSTVRSGDAVQDERLAAGYAQAEITPVDAVTLTAGARHDDYDSFGAATTWRLTGAWLIGGDTKLRASYGTGFMPPSLAARYGGPFQNPNPAIRAERSRGVDVGVDHYLLDGRGTIGLTWFRTSLRDLIGFQSAPFPELGTSINVDRARTTGLEASGRIAVHRVDVRVAYTLLSARSESDPDLARLIRRPKHTLSMDVAVAASSRATVGAGLLGARNRLDSDFNQFPSVRVDPGNYEVVRLYGSVLLTPRLTLRARVENLFDERYEEVYGFPALGRSLHGGLSVAF
jgi:vitamin B12 transporter